MNEGIGLCGVMELPLVIANVQRPGPATGMPTRTAQGDLQFVINSSQDEFPLMVIAPRNAEDAFYETVHALNLAEKYQMPIILLSDQYLADSKQNMPYFDLENNQYENYYFNNKEKSDIEDYKRYEITDNGISPLAYGGQLTNDIVLSDSHEHDEYGHVTETIELRNKMMQKRFKKIETLKENDLKEPLQLGTDNGDYLMICWGSTYGPAKEAFELLKADGHEVTLLSFNHVWPLPQEKLTALAKGKQLINIEGNYTAQFNKLIQQETCITVDHNILQYDGRPFTGKALYERIMNEVISNE
jgi:2-oxoglutarate ferredoxin oxidoreductase subunit alpha